MKGMPRLVLVLFLVCGIAAGSLAFVNAATKDRIAEFARLEREDALKQVFPGAEEFRQLLPDRQWEAMQGGVKAGYVFAATIQGYSGPIVSFFGLDDGDAITGVKVLTQSETPGLGARISEEQFLKQFRGQTAAGVALRKDDPAGAIDAITAATISSRAVAVSLRATLDAFQKGELK